MLYVLRLDSSKQGLNELDTWITSKDLPRRHVLCGLADIGRVSLAANGVEQQSLNVGWVVGLGKEVSGEGIVGLADGFFASGASLLLANLWEVDDEATSELMAAFYQGLLIDELSPLAALRQARSVLRSDPS